MTASDFRVTLLGTGVPIPSPDRFGPCTLVEAGDQKFLIDAGRGATIRLYQLKLPIGRIDVQLLTHYHSDHTSGVPDVWLTGWLESHFGTRKTPYRVIGPTGARELIENLERAYSLDIKIRVADEKLPRSGIATDVTEFDRDGTVYEKGGVRVIAFEVDHGDVIKPCYGYRFEYDGRVAVFSSDTRYNENVIKYGADADLLVHEVASARPELMREAYVQRIIGHHTTPREAGLVFAQTKPKLAAYTHIVQLGSERIPPPTIDDIVAETRETYSGPLVVGEDLMAFEIGETVSVRRFQPASSPTDSGSSMTPDQPMRFPLWGHLRQIWCAGKIAVCPLGSVSDGRLEKCGLSLRANCGPNYLQQTRTRPLPPAREPDVAFCCQRDVPSFRSLQCTANMPSAGKTSLHNHGAVFPRAVGVDLGGLL